MGCGWTSLDRIGYVDLSGLPSDYTASLSVAGVEVGEARV
jgi:hypothetical protein